MACMGDRSGAYGVLARRAEVKRPLGIPRHRWEDNIKIHFRQVVWGGVDWIDLAQDRDSLRAVVNGLMNLRVP